MKPFLFLLLANFLLVQSRVFSDPADDGLPKHGQEERDDFAPLQNCNSNTDCPESDCCLDEGWMNFCYSKPKMNDPCSPESGSCPCASDLVCKVYKVFKDTEFYRCMNPSK